MYDVYDWAREQSLYGQAEAPEAAITRQLVSGRSSVIRLFQLPESPRQRRTWDRASIRSGGASWRPEVGRPRLRRPATLSHLRPNRHCVRITRHRGPSRARAFGARCTPATGRES
jgi:hypothetical protein